MLSRAIWALILSIQKKWLKNIVDPILEGRAPVAPPPFIPPLFGPGLTDLQSVGPSVYRTFGKFGSSLSEPLVYRAVTSERLLREILLQTILNIVSITWKRSESPRNVSCRWFSTSEEYLKGYRSQRLSVKEQGTECNQIFFHVLI